MFRLPVSLRHIGPVVLLAMVIPSLLSAQDAHESLGASVGKNAKGPAPLLEEMRTLRSSPSAQLEGVHPRVYFTDAELDDLRKQAHGARAQEWKQVLSNIRALNTPPPPPPAEERRAQNEVAMGIAEAAFAYRIEGDPRLKEAALRYMDAAVSYKVWGYSFSKPNVDLAAGHLLYGLGVGYDLLYNELTQQQRETYRNKLALQGHLLYEAFRTRPGRIYAYSQNHTFIPMAGLGIAAYAVYGEVPEAAEWAKLARAVYQRVLQTYSHDGYYFEGYEYWIFATPWIIHYLDAQKHVTGEDLFDHPGFHNMYLYAAHDLLPGGQQMFDFGDVYEGSKSRAKIGDDYERSHPEGHFLTNYNVLYKLAHEFQDAKTQGVADWMRDTLHQTNAEPWWSFVWRDNNVASAPITDLPTFHRFEDMDVAFWRSSWKDDATAIAFKCGPPEGHATAELARKYPDWRLEDGHVHPDVNSFIVFAHGRYLTGDSGYAGVPKTIEHNTLLVDGAGQGKEGTHDAWGAIPYEQLNQIRITHAEMTADGFSFTGEGAAAYRTELGLQQFERTLSFHHSVLQVNDKLKANRDVRYEEVLHSDSTIGAAGKLQFLIPAENSALHVTVLAPKDAIAHTEANIVMGPGRPGSVDKGTPEQRGERLIVSVPAPVKDAHFQWKLAF